MTEYLSVSTLTKYLKLKFDKDPYLERVYLTGQVSNFRRRPNHQYFSLKDEKAVIQATIWGGVYKKLGFDLEEGMKINVIGRVQLYEPSGSYSIIIEKAEPDGIGALAIQFEQLKKKLGEEGLFEERFKQALPQFPKKIGVVTSPSGAVIRDIITTVSRRFPRVEIILYPTKVQGEGASAEVAENIRRANERNDLDVLIIGRGGGSIEDLWAFNEEAVVRAVYRSRIPVISAVGHETDTTLVDFVSDRRAATPSQAAEFAVPDAVEMERYLMGLRARLDAGRKRQIDHAGARLSTLVQRPWCTNPRMLIAPLMQRSDRATAELHRAAKEQSVAARHRLELVLKRLELLNPVRVLYRGFSIVEKDGRAVSRVKDVTAGDRVNITFADGKISAVVEQAKEQQNGA